jgi:integral membrane protein (TIGR01906 family)
VSSTLAARLGGIATATAAALVIVGIAIVPFLTPAWVAFEQGRSDALAWTGLSPAELRFATDSILRDLLIGGDFRIVMGSDGLLLNEREIGHMRDVQSVFAWFGLLVVIAAGSLVLLHRGARRLGHPERWWSAVGTGARWLIVGVVVGGIVAALAFDVAFEVFHRLFFSGGSYLFDPRTDRLVQLFPFAFWSETTIVLGGLIVVLAAIVAVAAARRARTVMATAVSPGTAAPGAGQPAEATR